MELVKSSWTILLFICFSGLTICFCRADPSSGNWKLSVDDTLVYSLSEGDDNRSIEIYVWKKNVTDWGTERIWINGSFLEEYIPGVVVIRQGQLPPKVNFQEEFCLDSVAGSTISSLNSSFLAYFYDTGSFPVYTHFNPFHLVAERDPAFFILPINSPLLNWSSWLIYSFESEMINSTGFVNDSVYYQKGDLQTPALQITFFEERTSTSNISSITLKTKKEKICWYSTEWGILLEYNYKSENWLNKDNETDYHSYEVIYKLQDTSVELYESEGSSVQWMSPLMILVLPVIYLIKKKDRR